MFKGEDIAKSLKTLLQSELEAALDDVESRWEDSDPVSLPDVVTWLLGHSPTVLERPQADFPVLAVLGPDRSPAQGSSQWGYQKSAYTVFVDCFVTAATEANVNKICWRYIEAVISVTQNNQSPGTGMVQEGYEPAVSISEAMRQYDDNSNDGYFTQMGRVTLRIEA